MILAHLFGCMDQKPNFNSGVPGFPEISLYLIQNQTKSTVIFVNMLISIQYMALSFFKHQKISLCLVIHQ